MFARTPKPRGPFPGPAATPSAVVLSAAAHGALLIGAAWVLGVQSSDTEADASLRDVVLFAAAPPVELVAEDPPAEDLTLEPLAPEPEPLSEDFEPVEEIPPDAPDTPAAARLDPTPRGLERTLPAVPPARAAEAAAPAQSTPAAPTQAATAESSPPAVHPVAEPAPSEVLQPAPELVPARPLASEGACPRPEYPRKAFRLGRSGTVVVTIDVRADGSVSDVRVTSSSGWSELDEEVLSTVRGWRFEPATRDGVARRSEVARTFVFDLNGVSDS